MHKKTQFNPFRANFWYLANVLIIGAFISLCLFFVLQDTTKAATGTYETINYQGRLLTSTGAVVPDGSYNMRFKVYQDGDGVLGGGDETLEWTETRDSGNKVLVRNGYFSVYLGSISPFGSNVDWNQDTLWLSVDIGGTGSPSWDGEMSPFTRFSSTPYAINSKYLSGLASNDFVQLAKGVQTDASTSNASISINKTGGIADIIDLMRASTSVFSIDNGGKALFKNYSDSSTAFQVLNSTNGQLFGVDSVNSLVSINGANSPKLKSWSSTSSLGTGRRTPSVVHGNNGYIYAVGGYNAGYLATSEYAKIKSDGTLGSWTSGTSLNTGRQGAATVVSNGYIYVIGGTSGSTLSDVEYARINADGTLGSWTVSPSNLNTARERTSAVAVNGYIYVVGGSDGANISSVEYARINADGTLGTWTTTTSLNTARNSHTTAAANGYIYAVAGTSGTALASTEYARVNADGTLGTWTTTTSLNTARNSHTSVVANGYLYAIAGSSGSLMSSVEYAQLNSNGTLGSWTADTNSIGTARDDLTSVVVNGYIYAIAGYDGNFSNIVEYTSTPRARIGGTLDLVGLSAGDLFNGENGGGGELTAGNTNIVGGLRVQGESNLLRGLNLGGNLSVGGSTISGASDLTIKSGGITSLSLLGEGGVYIDASLYGQTYIGTAGILQDVTVGNQGTSSATRLWAGTSGVTVQTGANTSTAFQVKNIGNVTVFGVDTSSSKILSALADGGSAVGFALNTSNTYSTSGAKLLSVQNNGSERMSIDKDGNLTLASGAIFKIDSTSGLTSSCTSGQFLRGQTALGGLTTGGTCAAVTGTEITDGSIANGDLANSSISLALGTSGTDINWGSGSVSLGGTATLNLPDASTSNRGLVTTGTQTFGGNKTFNNDLEVFGTYINLGNNSADLITATANFRASNFATGTTGTTTGTGTNTTTLTLIADVFAVNDVVLIDNAGQDYYTRITADPGTGSYTVSPAVTFEDARTVTKYNVQNVGATQSDYATLSDRFFQGYFLGGVVTGAGTTSLSDGLLYSSGALNINASAINFNANVDLANNLLLNIGNAGTDFTAGGGLTLAGALSGTTGSFSGAIAANGGITFDNSTDTLGAFTLAGTQDAGNNLIVNIGNAGTDFTSGGGLNVAGTLAANGGLTVQPSSAGTIGATITARSAQTADLFRIVDEYGDNLVTVNPNVGFTIKSSDGFTSSNAFSVVKLDTTETIIIGVNSATPGLYTESTSFNLINTSATTLNIGGAAGAGGINFAGGYGSTGCSIDGSNGNLSCNGSLTLGAGLSATTGTFSGAIAANGGITFDNATDTLGAFTLAGTLDANSNLITNIGNTGTDFVSGGGLTLAGTLTGNGVVSLGDGGDTFAINSTAFDVSTAGALTGITTIDTSGNITTGGTFVGNTRSGSTIAACTAAQFIGNGVRVDDGLITAGSCRTDGLSDGRVKENVEQVGSVLDKIKEVNVVTFDFNCDHELFTSGQEGCDTEHQTGVIAQQLAEVFPELVIQMENGYYKVNYDALSMYNLKAVGEMSQFIKSDGSADFSTIATDSLTTNTIKTASSDALNIEGDLVIDGNLVVDNIKANKIEGIEILSSRIGRLESDLSSSGGDSGNEPESIFGSLLADSIQTNSLDVAFDLNVGGTVNISEGLTVAGLTTFDGEVVFNRVARFVDEAIFGKPVSFGDRVTFSENNGGYAVIEKGETELDVKFKEAYEKDPVVNLTIKNGQFANFAYKDLDKEGFTIVLSKPAEEEVQFTWTAFEIDQPRTITGIPNQEDSNAQN